jgi:hypothetical protein
MRPGIRQSVFCAGIALVVAASCSGPTSSSVNRSSTTGQALDSRSEAPDLVVTDGSFASTVTHLVSVFDGSGESVSPNGASRASLRTGDVSTSNSVDIASTRDDSIEFRATFAQSAPTTATDLSWSPDGNALYYDDSIVDVTRQRVLPLNLNLDQSSLSVAWSTSSSNRVAVLCDNDHLAVVDFGAEQPKISRGGSCSLTQGLDRSGNSFAVYVTRNKVPLTPAPATADLTAGGEGVTLHVMGPNSSVRVASRLDALDGNLSVGQPQVAINGSFVSFFTSQIAVDLGTLKPFTLPFSVRDLGLAAPELVSTAPDGVHWAFSPSSGGVAVGSGTNVKLAGTGDAIPVVWSNDSTTLLLQDSQGYVTVDLNGAFRRSSISSVTKVCDEPAIPIVTRANGVVSVLDPASGAFSSVHFPNHSDLNNSTSCVLSSDRRWLAVRSQSTIVAIDLKDLRAYDLTDVLTKFRGDLFGTTTRMIWQ